MSDAINRAIDLSEEYDTMMEVQRNPCGAWMAIQEMAGIIVVPAVQPDTADRIEQLTDALDNLLQAITAEDQFHDRSLTITGSTANLRWLLEAEDDALAALKGESHE